MEVQTGGVYLGNGVHTFVFGYDAKYGWAYLPIQIVRGKEKEAEEFLRVLLTGDPAQLDAWAAAMMAEPPAGYIKFPFQSPTLSTEAMQREPVARTVFVGDGELEVHKAVKAICADIPMARMHTNTFLAVYPTNPLFFQVSAHLMFFPLIEGLFTRLGLIGNAQYDALLQCFRYKHFIGRNDKLVAFDDWVDKEESLYSTPEEKRMRVFLARAQGPDVSKMLNVRDDGRGGNPALDKLHVLTNILRTLRRVDGRWVHCDLHSGNAACLRNGVGVIHDFGMTRMLRYLDDRARGVTIPKQNNKYMFHTFIKRIAGNLDYWESLNQYKDVVGIFKNYLAVRESEERYQGRAEREGKYEVRKYKKAYDDLIARLATLRNPASRGRPNAKQEYNNALKRYKRVYNDYSTAFEERMAWTEVFTRSPTRVPFENRRQLVYPALLPPDAPQDDREHNLQMRTCIQDLVSLGKCYSVTGNEYSRFSDAYGPAPNQGTGPYAWGPPLVLVDGATVYLDPAFETRLHQLARVFDAFSIMRNMGKLWEVPDPSDNKISTIVQTLKDSVLVGKASRVFVSACFDEAILATYTHLGAVWNRKSDVEEDAEAFEYSQKNSSWNPALKWGKDQEAQGRAELANPVGFVKDVLEFRKRYDPATGHITAAGRAAEAAAGAAPSWQMPSFGFPPAAPALAAAAGAGPVVSDISSPETGVTYEIGPDGVRVPARALQAERLNDRPASGPVINNPEDDAEVSAVLAEIADVSAARQAAGRLAVVDDAFDEGQYSMPRSGRGELSDEDDGLENADIGVDGRVILPEHLELLRQAVAVAAPEDVPPPPVAPLGSAAAAADAAAAAAGAAVAGAAAAPLPLPPPGDIELLLPRGVQRERSPERPAAPDAVVPSPNERPRSRSRGPPEEGGRRRKRKVTHRNKKNVA